MIVNILIGNLIKDGNLRSDISFKNLSDNIINTGSPQDQIGKMCQFQIHFLLG